MAEVASVGRAGLHRRRALTRRRLALIAAVLVALTGGLAWVLVQAQSQARDRHLDRFVERTERTADYTARAIGTTGYVVKEYRRLFGGPAKGLQDALVGFVGNLPTPFTYVTDGKGRVLAALPQPPKGGRVRLDPRLRLRDLSARTGNVKFVAKTPVLAQQSAFEARFGPRVIIASIGLDELQQFVSGYLASAPAVKGASAYLIDGKGRVLVGLGKEKPAERLRDPDVLAAARHGGSSVRDGRHFVAARVASSEWSVVFAASEKALFATVSGREATLTWVVFGAFCLTLLLAMALCAGMLRTSSELAASTEREHAARQLAYERLHDALTDLPNRALFLDRLELALGGVTRNDTSVAVMFFDIDGFKRINDSLGHASGDDLLRAIARRLRGAMRPGDSLSRFGGDEFLVLCTVQDQDEALGIARRLQAAVEQPIRLGDREIHVTACAGVAVRSARDIPTDASSLVADADSAMYRAKRSGRNAISVFDDELHRRSVQRLDMENALRRGIDGGELRVFYQSIVSLADGRHTGVEALVRWDRPGHGVLEPADFIGLAEESGLIAPLGARVIEQACLEVGGWQRAGIVDDAFTLSINLSPQQLRDPQLKQTVADALLRSGLGPGSLCLEMTESGLVQDIDLAIAVLSELKGLGVRLALDDFGIGHSSLSQVARMLPMDVIKLDRSFVAEMDQPRDHAIVAAVANLGSSLGLVTVAEGVETSSQASQLAELGYPLAQGFLYSRPQPGAVARAMLTTKAAALRH